MLLQLLSQVLICLLPLRFRALFNSHIDSFEHNIKVYTLLLVVTWGIVRSQCNSLNFYDNLKYYHALPSHLEQSHQLSRSREQICIAVRTYSSCSVRILITLVTLSSAGITSMIFPSGHFAMPCLPWEWRGHQHLSIAHLSAIWVNL